MTVKMLLNSPFYKIITVTKMMITMIKMALLKTTMTKIVLPIFAIFFLTIFLSRTKLIAIKVYEKLAQGFSSMNP